MTSRRSPLEPAVRGVAAGLLVVLSALVAYGFWGFSYDDNFITYRYARNLAQGAGLVFNVDQPVLGTSAPGYAFLLAGLATLSGPLGIDVPEWGTVISILSLLTVVCLLYVGLGRAGHATPEVSTLATAVVLLPLPIVIQLLGAEGFVVAALVALATDALFRSHRPVIAGLLVAVAMMVRLDAGLAAAALGLVAWHHGRRLPWAFALAGLGPMVPWLLYLWHTFGRFVPHTIEGKTALRDVPYTLRTWQWLEGALGSSGAMVLVCAGTVGFAVVLWQGWFRRPAPLALALWLLGHEVAYRVIGVWFAPWYEIYLVIVLGVVAPFGITTLLASLWKHLSHQTRAHQTRVPSSIAVAGVTMVLLMPVLVPSARFVGDHWRQPPDPRFTIYADAGRYLRDETPSDATVLAFEIGVLGYVAERPILDLGALVSPRFVEPKFSGTRPEAAAASRPDYIVDIESNPLMRRVVAAEGVRDAYDTVVVFRDARFGGGRVSVLKRTR